MGRNVDGTSFTARSTSREVTVRGNEEKGFGEELEDIKWIVEVKGGRRVG